jgi:hypothetical protein
MGLWSWFSKLFNTRSDPGMLKPPKRIGSLRNVDLLIEYRPVSQMSPWSQTLTYIFLHFLFFLYLNDWGYCSIYIAYNCIAVYIVHVMPSGVTCNCFAIAIPIFNCYIILNRDRCCFFIWRISENPSLAVKDTRHLGAWLRLSVCQQIRLLEYQLSVRAPCSVKIAGRFCPTLGRANTRLCHRSVVVVNN